MYISLRRGKGGPGWLKQAAETEREVVFMAVEVLADRIGKVVGSDDGESARVIDGRKKTFVVMKRQRNIISFRTKSFD